MFPRKDALAFVFRPQSIQPGETRQYEDDEEVGNLTQLARPSINAVYRTSNKLLAARSSEAQNDLTTSSL